MTEELKGWELLLAPLPEAALKPLSSAVYGVSNLTDVNEAYLWERLHASGLHWSLEDPVATYIGHEDRTPRDEPNKVTRYYLATASITLVIADSTGIRRFPGVGAHDNRKLDAALKGAATTAFKNACKWAGMTMSLYKGGQIQDVIYEGESGRPAPAPDPARGPAKDAPAAAPKGGPSLAVTSNPLTPNQQKTLRGLCEVLPEEVAAAKRVAGAIAAVREREGWTPDQIWEAAWTTIKALHNEHCPHEGEHCSHIAPLVGNAAA